MISSQSGQAQSLAASIEAMLQNFPEIKVGQADVRIQETAINTAHSQRLPQLGLSLRGGEERFRNSASRYSLSKIGGFSFDASQLLFDGGSARSRVREAQALNQLSEIELESTRQVLALDLSQTYVDIIKYRALLGFAEESARIHRIALDKTSQKFRAGAGPQADVELVTARLSMSKAILEASRRQLAYAVNNYRKYTALDPDALEEPEFPDWALPLSIEEVNLARNPRIRSALANISATEARHRGAKSAFFPQLDLLLQSSGSDSARYANQQQDSSGLIVMSYNIFGGGRRKANLQQTLSSIDKATYELETTESELGAAFMNAWNDLTIAEERLYRLEDYRDAMTSVVSAYQQQFELGQRALINVLDVENELFSAKSSVAEERYNRIQAAYRILSLNGTLLENLQ
ncbi:MAG: TolC family protein [Opitutaceae bacterium]|nr:TolC family protein [Opitutaceae bacterium]